MTILLICREFFQKIYSRYSMQVTIVLKFMLGCFVFYTINDNLGFMERLDNPIVIVGLAALSSFLPLMVMVLSAILLIAAHLYTISIPVMGVTLFIFLILYIFYFRFTPGKTWTILLVPMAFFFEIPLVVPIVFGLLGSPLLIVPAISGTIVYYLLYYIQNTESIYTAEGISEMIEVTVYFIENIVMSEYQWLMAFVLGIGVLIVYAIRSRSFDHSWKVAVAAGVVWLFGGIHLGTTYFGIEEPIVALVTNLILAAIAGVILEFFFFRVDYSRTEYLQFNDNEYYYYVKAIPKRFSTEWQRKQEEVRRREEMDRQKEIERRRIGIRPEEGELGVRPGQEGRLRGDRDPRFKEGGDPSFKQGQEHRGIEGGDPRFRDGQMNRARESSDPRVKNGQEVRGRKVGDSAPRENGEARLRNGQKSRVGIDLEPTPRESGELKLMNGQESKRSTGGEPALPEGEAPRRTGRLDPGPRKERVGLSVQALSELLPNSPFSIGRKKDEDQEGLGETIVIDTAEIKLNTNGQNTKPEKIVQKEGENGRNKEKKSPSQELTSLDELLGLDSFEDDKEDEKTNQNKKAGSSKKKDRGSKRKGQK